ncbi:SLC45 family MFS transporter [Paenibacillus senegalensis]|uniref:SLC45 family MFS transporter n=1 Tax=Paenibacillus senegalensis TaxID=1465766 RepID=UPI00028915D9|nr:SLC45 family MFS transporter [Paenibacillus senegalensis]
MKKTWLLGFGFFSISITWSLYNAFVPLFLERFLTSTALIGFMMTIDNYFALFLQPWIGRRSDRTNTRFGRRMPYLLIGMPLAALFVALVPFHNSLLLLVLLMMAMNLSMSLFRSPTISLMPDITPEAQRTKANGIINFMGGIGAILAFGAGSMLYRADPSFPFIASAFVILFAMFILQRSIKERRDTLSYTISEKQELNFKGQLDRTTIFLLLAIFFWFVGYQGVEALFTLYGTNQLGMDDAEAGFSLTFFSLAFVIFAIPSGWMGAKFGKKKVILAGVVGLALVFLAINWVETIVMLRILLLIGGAFWACININSYPFIVSTGTDAAIGTRTGLYYLVSSLAAIASPPLLGLLIDFFGYSILFYCASAAMGLALVCLLMIKHNGESTPAHQSVGLSGK